MKFIQNIRHYPKIGLILLSYIAFIALGMPDGLLGIAWPSIRAGFGVSLDAVGMMIPISVAGYMTSSFFSGPITARWGIGRVLTASCALTGTALIGYTLVPQWWMMAALGLLSGLGAGAIDAGLNNYVAAHFNEGLMQWLHASYGVGVTIGPVLMTIVLATWNSWRIGYRAVGGFQFLMALCFFLTLPMWNHGEEKRQDAGEETHDRVRTPMLATMRQASTWLSALLFSLYVGAEITFGTWTYSLLTEARGINATLAGVVASSYWATFTVGRILAGLYIKKLSVGRVIQGSLAAAFLGSLLLWWNPSQWTNLAAVGLIGLAVAPIFPALMSGTMGRVGEEHTANTIGIQMAATGLGGAVIPSLLGVLAARYSLEVMPVCMMVVFALIFVLFRLVPVTTSASKGGKIINRA